MKRKNLNRGYKKLEVWNDAVELYVLICEHLSKLPYAYTKSVSNVMDASYSIIRNIPEGYCRRSLKEYLTFIYYALGSCGELHSSLIVFQKAEIITDEAFEVIDVQHYKAENKLMKLAESLHIKLSRGEKWSDSFIHPSIHPAIQSYNKI